MRGRLIPVPVLALSLLCGCFYTHGSYQSARLLATGETEFVPYYQAETFKMDGLSDLKGAEYGVQVAHGLSESINVRLRFEKLAPDGMDAWSYIGLGPKFGKPDGRFAFDLPVGMFFGKAVREEKSWQIHPTGIFSLPLTSSLELTGFAKLLFFFDTDTDPLYSVGLGGGVWTPGKQFTVRPEISMVKGFRDSGTHTSIGVGVAYTLTGGR